MNGSIRRVLLPAVALVGVAGLGPASARAAKGSVHIYGHFPAHHATFIHPRYHAHGHFYHPHRYSLYHAPPAVYHAPPAIYVYRAPVVVRGPAVGFWLGPVPSAGPVPPPSPRAHYYVW